MKRIKGLTRYQKGVLLLMIVMVVVFSVLYPMTIDREGFEYKDVILIPHQENGHTIYSGKIQGKQATFTVSTDKKVKFQYGDTVYGPYTVKKDSTAIPEDIDLGEDITGIELYHGNEMIFRGGIHKHSNQWWLYNEDGELENLRISFETSDRIEMDMNGNVIDPMEPSVATILELMAGPKLTHKGEWSAWTLSMFICIVTAISILFVDELFLFNLAFQIRNVEHAEPSEWEIAGRYISWTVLPVMALVLFIVGLQ